jgi:hypothetical protein
MNAIGAAMGDAELSKLLFEARELIEMFADVVESRTGAVDASMRVVVCRIDEYRAGRGWNPDGFGAEDCVCNVGVQECPRHPGRLRTQEEKIAFRKAWDGACARVESC